MSRGVTLSRLQHADDAVEALRADIRSLEAAVAGDAELDRTRAGAQQATAERMSAAEAAAAAEAEFDALQGRVRKLNRRLYDGTVRNPQELLEMQAELETIKRKADEFETGALALLESLDAAEKGEQTAIAAVDAGEQRRAEELEPLRRRLETRRADLAEAEAQRADAAAGVSATDMRLYERVSSKHRPAVVHLAGDSCGGCHLPLSIDERRSVRTGPDLVQCPNCDRIVVP